MRSDSSWTEFISLQQQRLPSNQSCLLQSGICGTLYGNPATEPLFEEFCEVHCLKLNILCCDFARIMVISLIVLSYNVIFRFGKRKKLHRLLGFFQASLESAATILLLLLTLLEGHKFVSNLMHVQAVFQNAAYWPKWNSHVRNLTGSNPPLFGETVLHTVYISICLVC